MLHRMTTPLTVVRITESCGGIQRFASRISFIHEQTDIRQTDGIGFLFSSFEQPLSDTLATIFRENGQ